MPSLTQEIKNLIKCNDEHARTLLDYHESLLSHKDLNNGGTIGPMCARIRNQYRSLMNLQQNLLDEVRRIENPAPTSPPKLGELREQLDAKGNHLGFARLGEEPQGTIDFHDESKTFAQREAQQREKSGLKGS